jgi:hypothetical protein
MTREQYLIMIQQPEIPMSLWFEYYLDRGGVVRSFEEFERVFSILMWNESTMKSSNGQMKQITFGSALRNLYEYYNKKFGL